MPTLRELGGALKVKATVLMMALKHPRTPWYAKTCGVVTLLYLLAPIDLIPDFIPSDWPFGRPHLGSLWDLADDPAHSK